MATPSYLQARQRGKETIELFTTQQVADELGISYENVKYRIRERKVKPTMQMGRNNLYDRETLEKLR